MNRLKIIIVICMLGAVIFSVASQHVAHSQKQISDKAPATGLTAAQAAVLNANTDQANKVSSSNALASGAAVDNEGVDPSSTDTFTFDTDPNARPAAAAARPCPTPACCLMCDCVQPACDPEDLPPAAEAPAGFDNHTNGFIPQGQPIPKFPAAKPNPGNFEADKFIFSIVDENDDGLGPVYNAQSCRECHQNPVVGGISQVTELRAGHNDSNGNFVDAPGGSLINDRATDAKVQERVPPLFTAGVVGGGAPISAEEPIRTFRTSLNLLGDGFVEAIANGSLLAIAQSQSALSGGQVHGQAIRVPVLESAPNNYQTQPFPGSFRVGRFGWKNQQASLLSFSSDAYLNEMGITNRLIPNENTSLGRFVGFGSGFDIVPDNQPCDDNANVVCAEDPERDIDAFTEFMRATKVPPQDANIQAQYAADISAGRQLFSHLPVPNAPAYSCNICHVPAILTALPGTQINGGQFAISDTHGFTVIRPFGDFLLHDIGTGDGIVQNGGQTTALKVRTAPLWGVRTRTRLLHDGESLTLREAILRHQGEAAAFQLLSEQQKRQLIKFLESL